MKDVHPSAQKLSLISFNALGAPFVTYWTPTSPLLRKYRKQRFEKIAEALRDVNADIVCFQEVHTYPLLAVLKRELPQYQHIAYQKYLYGPKGGLVIFSKFPFEHVKYVTYTKKGSWFNTSIVSIISRKGLLAVKLHDFPVHLINTHLTANTDGDYSVKNKYTHYIKAQLKELKQFIASLANRKTEVIVLGDFNMPKNSSFYDEFIAATNMKDVFAETSTPTYHKEYLPEGREAHRLDYIFVRNNTPVQINNKAHILNQKVPIHKKAETFLSDHIGLKVDLTFLKK